MDTVSRHVTFPSGGETLAGTLFTPPGPPDGRLPAVVVAGGQTCVKEQMAGRYAGRLAARGYAALAFDFRGFGESTGQPRDYESPSRKIEDIRGAFSFLADQPGLDPGRLAALGIGVGAGHVAVEAASDRRVRALALVAPALQDPEIVLSRWPEVLSVTVVPRCSALGFRLLADARSSAITGQVSARRVIATTASTYSREIGPVRSSHR